MTDAGAERVVAAIKAHLEELPVGSMSFFGDIFGGRVDNWHTVVSANAMPESDCLRVIFDEEERLLVWEPRRATIDDAQFVIVEAKRVRWSWYMYGEPQTPEYLRFLDYEVKDGSVRVMSDAEWFAVPDSLPLSEPAVQMLR